MTKWYHPGDSDYAELDLQPTVNKGVASDKHGKLYFWDEAGVDCYGPFDGLSSLLQELDRYVKWLR